MLPITALIIIFSINGVVLWNVSPNWWIKALGLVNGLNAGFIVGVIFNSVYEHYRRLKFDKIIKDQQKKYKK